MIMCALHSNKPTQNSYQLLHLLPPCFDFAAFYFTACYCLINPVNSFSSQPLVMYAKLAAKS